MCKFGECFLVPSSGWIWKVLSSFRFTAWHLHGYFCHLLTACVSSNLIMTALFVCLANGKRRLLWDKSSPWDVLLEHIWGRMGVKRADGFGMSSFSSVTFLKLLPQEPWLLGISAALGPGRGRKICSWDPRSSPSAMSWIAFVSRRFWGTWMEALPFFKVVQKTSLSWELGGDNILLFEKFVLIFYMLTLKKDLELWFPALCLQGKGNLLCSKGVWPLQASGYNVHLLYPVRL